MLASSASFALVVMFACATAFKYAELTGLDDIKDILSDEQQSLYLINSFRLTVIIFASVIFSLVVSLIIFLFQLNAEGARLCSASLSCCCCRRLL